MRNNPIVNLAQAEGSKKNAETDLDRLNKILEVIKHVPFKPSEQELAFMIEMWGSFTPETRVKEYLNRCELAIETLESYLETVKTWIKKNPNKHYFRCALTKKKQRELGMIPKL